MLQIKKLTCSRNEQNVFKEITCELMPGQALQLTGANGSGKTTLLQTIAGLLTPASGKVIIDRSNICYIGHKCDFHPDLTIMQNLEFLQTLFGLHIELSKIKDALKYFSLTKLANKKIIELSAGQKQRASLTRLLLTPRRIWLLDEPLANLDAEGAGLLQKMCTNNLASSGMILLATHQLLDLAPFQHVQLGLN